MSDVVRRDPVVAVADEPLRAVVYRMAETGFTRMPVVDSGEEHRIVGMISLDDRLHARARNLSEERSRERVLHIRLPFRGARNTAPVQE
jgi:CBS domain-containing protein